jgi:hypothetical protein
MFIVVGAPTTRMFVMTSPASHHGHWSGVSFKNSGEERQILSQLTEDQKSKVSSSTPHYLHHKGKLK